MDENSKFKTRLKVMGKEKKEKKHKNVDNDVLNIT